MRIRGAVERKNADVISGWMTVDPGADSVQALEILVGEQVVGRIEANTLREDVRSAGIGDGVCGFQFRMPPDIEPQKAAEARVRLVGTEIYLTGKGVEAADAPKSLPGAGSVFILGPARSGTSVLFLALKEVLGLRGFGEGHVMPIFQRMLFNYYQHAKGFAGQTGVLASTIDVTGLEDHLLPYIRRFYHDHFEGQPFVDKTPGLEALIGAPFVRKVFPGAKIVVTTRNGVELIESYRRKFSAGFDDACREWAGCAKQIGVLHKTMPDALFIDQYEMRSKPYRAAEEIAEAFDRAGQVANLADFLRTSRKDVLSRSALWAQQATIDTIGWTQEEKSTYLTYAERVQMSQDGDKT